VLSHEAWTRLSDRDPAILGRSIEINRHKLVIVGVMAPEFTGMDDLNRDVWVPMTMYGPLAKVDLFGADQPSEVNVIVRLAPAVTAARAEQALSPFIARVVEGERQARGARERRRPDTAANREAVAQPVVRLRATPNPLSLDVIALLSPVFAAFGLVLAAACANVSNVMLARANARHREIAVRLSLGASRGRVVRQLLTEGLLLALLGGAAGLTLAAFALRFGTSMLFLTLPPTPAVLMRVMPLDFDHRVFLFALAVATGTTLLFALVPALQATRLQLTPALRGDASGKLRASTLRNMLVVGQVAVSLVLLVGASTLVRNGSSIAAIELGFRARDVFSVNQRGNGDPLVARAATALRSDPRVTDLAVTSRNPLFGQMERAMATPLPGSRANVVTYVFVSPEYFPIVEIPIVRGRAFRSDEARGEAPVAVVSAAAAARLWPSRDPVGQRVRLEVPAGGGDALARHGEVQVVGVARDVVSGMVYEGEDAAHVYLPTSDAAPHASAILVRSRSSRDLRVDSVQRLLERTAADPMTFAVIPLPEMLDVQMYPLRAASWIGSALGFIALALSVSGLYGVLTYVLGQRRREIGIRMALGATAAAVVRLVMRYSARLVGVGAAVGLVFAFSVMKVLSAVVRLQKVSLLDVTSFAVGIILVVVAAALAAYVPARRASAIDPSTTLRSET
jgi:predicted permease